MKPSFCLVIYLFSLLLLSCKNYRDTNEKPTALSDSTSFTGLTGDSIKLVKSGNLILKVKDIQESARAVSNLAQKLGGMIFNQNLEYEETGRKELWNSTDSITVITVSTPQAAITVRVPSENLEEFMYNVSKLGYFTSSSKMHIVDQSLRYLENELKHKSRTQTFSERKKDTSFTTLQAIGVKDAAIEQQIRNKNIDADANYSIVSLTLFQNPLVSKEVIANAQVADYQLPFSQRIGHSIHNGWKFFLEFILVVAHLWMFILISLSVFLSYRIFHQKRKLNG